MQLAQDTIEALALRLDEAEAAAAPIVKITDDYPEIDLEDAYAIQDALLARKRQRGVGLVGLKMGFTSWAKMAQMNVHEPIHGVLTDQRHFVGDAEMALDGLIHPKCEPEIAFLTKAELRGPGCHVAAVLAATEALMPAIEIIDSRYKGYKFDLNSVIADNTSAAGQVIGTCHCKPFGLDLNNLGVVVECNGKVVSMASGAAVLGHPAQSIAMLANILGRRGRSIPAGSLILSGGISEAVSLSSGDVLTLHMQGFGSLSLHSN